jgi:phosphoribosylanthranilate isomerase
LPPFVTTVGLFVNASRCELNEILEVVPLDLLQFHGDETPQDCEGYHRPWIKALRVRPGDDLEAACQRYAVPAAFAGHLCARRAWGTGEAFDWSLIPRT